MNLNDVYYSIKTPQGSLMLNKNETGFFTTANKAQGYLDRSIAYAKNRMEGSSKRLKSNPLNAIENEKFKAWEKRYEELKSYVVIPIKVIEQ